MAKPQGRWLLMGLAAVALVSLWRAGSVQQQKNRITQDYEQAQQVLAQLEKEHGNLSSELSLASRTMAGQALEINSLQRDLEQVQSHLQETVSELAILRQEHRQMRAQNVSLADQLASVSAERTQLEARLASLNELRLAIRDVKEQMRDERWAAWRARVDVQKAEDQRLLAMGNRGYLIRDGAPTTGSAARLRVHVREPQAAP